MARLSTRLSNRQRSDTSHSSFASGKSPADQWLCLSRVHETFFLFFFPQFFHFPFSGLLADRSLLWAYSTEKKNARKLSESLQPVLALATLLKLIGNIVASTMLGPSLLLSVVIWTVEASNSHNPLPGHRQPIGNHRPAELKIDEFIQPISGQLFFERYVSTKQPVVFRNFARQWPAFTKWTDDYVRKNFGDLEVKIEPRTDGSYFGAEGVLGIGRDTIGSFADTYAENDKYIVSELPTAMYKDVLVAPCLTCGELADSLAEIDLWWSGGGTRSRLHRDAFNAINCLLNGTKEWITINNNETDGVYFVPYGEFEMGGLSPIDVDDVDLREFPRFAHVKYGFVKIEAGDCIFMPGGKFPSDHPTLPLQPFRPVSFMT